MSRSHQSKYQQGMYIGKSFLAGSFAANLFALKAFQSFAALTSQKSFLSGIFRSRRRNSHVRFACFLSDEKGVSRSHQSKFEQGMYIGTYFDDFPAAVGFRPGLTEFRRCRGGERSAFAPGRQLPPHVFRRNFAVELRLAVGRAELVRLHPSSAGSAAPRARRRLLQLAADEQEVGDVFRVAERHAEKRRFQRRRQQLRNPAPDSSSESAPASREYLSAGDSSASVRPHPVLVSCRYRASRWATIVTNLPKESRTR